MPKIMGDYRNQAKARIVQAGRSAFSSRGYRLTTMEEIAKDVGVTKGDLYHYFPGKAALLREIVRTSRQSSRQSIQEALSKADSRETIVRILEQIVTDEVPGAGLWYELVTGGAGDADLKALMLHEASEDIRAVKGILVHLSRIEPRVRVERIDDLALAIVALLHGTVLEVGMGANWPAARRALLRALRALLSA